MSTDLIVDGNSLYARSWFAAESLTGIGDPTKTIQFAVTTLLNLLNPDTNRMGFQFDRTFFAWDSTQHPSKHRKTKPPDYHPTKTVLIEILSVMLGTQHYWHDDYEGDDIVATAVYQSDPKDKVYIVSGDKDLMQLQGGNCEYYCLNTKAVLSKGYITNKFQIKRTNQVALALAVLGDKVDNVPGIKGWGPRKVQRLFQLVDKHMPFDRALQAVEAQIPEDLKPVFYESLERVLLKTDVPGVPPPAPIQMPNPVEIGRLEIPELSYRYQVVYNYYMVEPY